VKVYRSLDEFTVNKPVVTIGTFDGVHLGHQKVIDSLKSIATEMGGETVLFTFYPHPRLVVNPNDDSLRLLTSLNEKIKKLEAVGVDHLVVFPFTPSFARLSYEEFVRSVLVDQMHVHALVVGHDHRFGHNREGGYERIKTLADSLNFSVLRIEALSVENTDVSSTKIRDSLLSGAIAEANHFLGAPYTLRGTVLAGKQLGRTIGYPTANVLVDDSHKLIPATGVYAARVVAMGANYNAMLNIGFRPTVSQQADSRTIEVHLFDFSGDLYQQDIEVQILERIRNEQKFESVQQLQQQLRTDEQTVRTYFENHASF
jgi:riboflavin kinase / FMN adenylyltransferase